MIEAAARYNVHVLPHCQLRVECDAKVSDTVQRCNINTADRQSDATNFRQLLWRSQPDELGFFSI
jgi:hypothetical protein